MPDLFSQIPPVAMPEVIPSELPQQRFHLGEWVRWFQVPNGEYGRVIGVIYAQQASCIATGLHYLVLLDERSPSRKICTCDFAFEDDIESLEKSSLERLRGNSADGIFIDRVSTGSQSNCRVFPAGIN